MRTPLIFKIVDMLPFSNLEKRKLKEKLFMKLSKNQQEIFLKQNIYKV